MLLFAATWSYVANQLTGRQIFIKQRAVLVPMEEAL